MMTRKKTCSEFDIESEEILCCWNCLMIATCGVDVTTVSSSRTGCGEDGCRIALTYDLVARRCFVSNSYTADSKKKLNHNSQTIVFKSISLFILFRSASLCHSHPKPSAHPYGTSCLHRAYSAAPLAAANSGGAYATSEALNFDVLDVYGGPRRSPKAFMRASRASGISMESPASKTREMGYSVSGFSGTSFCCNASQ